MASVSNSLTIDIKKSPIGSMEISEDLKTLTINLDFPSMCIIEINKKIPKNVLNVMNCVTTYGCFPHRHHSTITVSHLFFIEQQKTFLKTIFGNNKTPMDFFPYLGKTHIIQIIIEQLKDQFLNSSQIKIIDSFIQEKFQQAQKEQCPA